VVWLWCRYGVVVARTKLVDTGWTLYAAIQMSPNASSALLLT